MKNLLLFLICVVLFFSSCEQYTGNDISISIPDNKNQERIKLTKIVYSGDYMDSSASVSQIEIEGHTYILAIGWGKVSICPSAETLKWANKNNGDKK